jgi:hypothetical protein
MRSPLENSIVDAYVIKVLPDRRVSFALDRSAMLYTVTITATIETPIPATLPEIQASAIDALTPGAEFWVHGTGTWARWSLISAKALAMSESDRAQWREQRKDSTTYEGNTYRG